MTVRKEQPGPDDVHRCTTTTAGMTGCQRVVERKSDGADDGGKARSSYPGGKGASDKRAFSNNVCHDFTALERADDATWVSLWLPMRAGRRSLLP